MKFLSFLFCVCLFACAQKYQGVPEKYHALLDQALLKAGDNSVELKKALDSVAADRKEGMAYLIAYMPERDLKELNADFLLENVNFAYKAREQFPWGKEVPDSVFFNDVLPYVSMNETRDAWRKDFYERFSKYVANCGTIFEAIDSVNKNVRDEVMVDYNTRREKPDQSPYESIRQGMASCSGLSIILTDAFRAVGIPSRVAGTPNWHDQRGNHNWTEVWAGGDWYFTEFYFNKLNQYWFFADAGQAVADDPEHAIYATSFKPTGIPFPLVWDENIKYVQAENVTNRYLDQYKAYESSIMGDGSHVQVRLMMFSKPECSLNSDDRVAVNVDVFCGKLQVGGGRTASPTQDMNDVLTFNLEKDKMYTFKYQDAAGNLKPVDVKVADKPVEVKLYME